MRGAAYGEMALDFEGTNRNHGLSGATRSCTKFKNKGHLGQKYAWILEIFPRSLQCQRILNVIESFLYTILLEGLLIICCIMFGLTSRLI